MRYWRGRIWAGKGDEEKAVAEYSDAIRLDPEDAASFEARAQAWLARGERDRAIADFTSAIDLDEEPAHVLVQRGDIWFAKDELDKAIAPEIGVLRFGFVVYVPWPPGLLS